MYQVMRRASNGTMSPSSTSEPFRTLDEAVDYISQHGAPSHTYVVIPINGHPAYTVEETISRTLHKLPVLVGQPK